jgi:hypothetical protein
VGSDQIRVDGNDGIGQLLESQYADIAFLKAMCFQNQGDHQQSLQKFNQGRAFFNGTGFNDWQSNNPNNNTSFHQHQTYKLALCMCANKYLSRPMDQTALKMLLGMQAPDGGFYTGYNTTFSHGSSETNAETTSLAILALFG